MPQIVSPLARAEARGVEGTLSEYRDLGGAGLERLQGRLVGAGDGAEGDAQAVPAIDGDDGQSEVCEFLGRETRLHAVVDVVFYMRFGHECNGLGPFERGSLSIGVLG